MEHAFRDTKIKQIKPPTDTAWHSYKWLKFRFTYTICIERNIEISPAKWPSKASNLVQGCCHWLPNLYQVWKIDEVQILKLKSAILVALSMQVCTKLQTVTCAHIFSPIFRSHVNCVKYAPSKFFLVCWKLSMRVMAYSYSISFDLFIHLWYFWSNRCITNKYCDYKKTLH